MVVSCGMAVPRELVGVPKSYDDGSDSAGGSGAVTPYSMGAS